MGCEVIWSRLTKAEPLIEFQGRIGNKTKGERSICQSRVFSFPTSFDQGEVYTDCQPTKLRNYRRGGLGGRHKGRLPPQHAKGHGGFLDGSLRVAGNEDVDRGSAKRSERTRSQTEAQPGNGNPTKVQ